nr:nucleotide-binding alpha-beta plait domain-containing protein [Tanacetum cinerariifolium]
MDITLTLSPITLFDIQFNTPSSLMPSPPLFGHPVLWNLLEAHEATCLFLDNKDGIRLSQTKYCLELLHEYGLLAAKHVDTSLHANANLNHIESDDDHLLDNTGNYQRLVDVSLRVLRYLKGSLRSSIQINKNGNLKLRAYVDYDWARCPATRKSISGHQLRLSTEAWFLPLVRSSFNPKMGNFRSKEDDVSRISISIFITNFPDSFSAKDLFHSCKQYGHVVDSFIPTKRTKDGKRFEIVRFINVFNVERLVNNLCTIWVGRLKFHANVARFKREFMKGSGNADKMENVLNKSKPNGPQKEVGKSVIGKSFMSVVKDSKLAKETESSPAIVLEDDCLNARDLSLSLMGRVKELASLANHKKALCNEGFDGVKISYLGELWILLEFETAKAKDSFRGSVGAGSWFSVLKKANAEFAPEGRLVWVEVDGIPFKFWSGPTFKRIAAKWGKLLDVDDYDETNFHSKRFCILTKVCENIYVSFKIVFRGKVYWVRASEVPGWTPEFFEEEEEDNLSVEGNNDGKPNVHEVNNDNEESDMEEVTKEDHSLSHPPGFTSGGDLNEGNVVGGHATKVYGENKRGDNLFVNLEVGKDNSDSVNKNSESTCSGRFKESKMPRMGRFYFKPYGGCCEGIDILIVVVYAPQEAKEKRMLWDYLSHVSSQWDGKIVMMGDFNEVRYKSDRFGSNFNAHDAEIFNSFIYNAGLEEVPLGGNIGWKLMDLISWLEILGMMNLRGDISLFKEELRSCDEVIDKAKIKWAVEGDENMKFFHGMLNKKRSQSNIRGVMIDKPSENRACIDISFPNSLSNDPKEDLELVFEAVDYFFMHGDMPNGCNSNFIALIPKILDENMVKDIRPISLIRSLYKIIAKILVNRLVGVLDDLVNEVQSIFVADKQILDEPFILNEGSIIVNGSPTEEFQFFRGLKQGDPLSPFLFILIMKSLHISFQRVVDAGLFTGIKINSMVNLSHLFYADDAIFLGQWSELNIDSLVQVLECFFGLLVSVLTWCKSKIMGVNVVDGKVKNAAVKLGCLVLKTPFTYLGTKIGDIMSRKHAWKEVVDK